VPPPRQGWTWRQVTPLVGFLVVYAICVTTLVLTDFVYFTRPAYFALMIVSVWVWWMHLAGFSGLSKGRALAALWTRLTLIGLFVMMLADPMSVKKSNDLAVVYALDVSDSIGQQASDQAVSYITKTVTLKPDLDEAGLVVFGREAAVELPPRTAFLFEAINTRLAKDGSNIQKALALSAAILPEDKKGRIVLISDGTETDGDYASALKELKARGITVDVLPVEYEYNNEVWLEKLELPKSVKKGETYEAHVVLNALSAGEGEMVLLENGNEIHRQPVNYQTGKNKFSMPIYLRQAGYYEYTAQILPKEGKDTWENNNKAINFVYLQGESKTLLVTNPGGDGRDYQKLQEILMKAGRSVDTVNGYEFPRDSMSLIPYDAIVFVNVPSEVFDVAQMTAVRDSVYNLGTGFLMVGGQNSFGAGGYNKTPVEEALPVTMDITQKKVMPKGALAIILHTCEFAEGNTYGKEIAKEAIRVLSARDEVGILVYDYQGAEKWLFNLTPAGDYEKLVPLINGAQIGDMPSFASTMEMGYQSLSANDAAVKHMIVISDGDPQPPTPQLIQKFVDAKISISMVAVFPHGGADISIMQSISSATGGRYYFPQDPQQLPGIFIKEAKTLKRNLIQNKTFVPQQSDPSAILKGIGTLPQLKGYVLTTPKPRSMVVLKAPEEDQIDPILATWKFGLGTSAAFTSDLSPNWAASWMDWDQNEAFVKQMMIDISRVNKASALDIQAYAVGSQGFINVEDHNTDGAFLEVQATAAGPSERSEKVILKQVGPRRYQGTFPLWGQGRYQVIVAGLGDNRIENGLSGFVLPYSPEYLRFKSNPIALKRIAMETGGRILTGKETGKEIFGGDRKMTLSLKPVFDWMLVLLAILVPIDVGIRRIQLDFNRVMDIFRRKKKGDNESTATMGALLKTKERVKTERDETTKPISPLLMRKKSGESKSGPPEKSIVTNKLTEKPTEPAPGDEGPVNTTSHLLKRKRKRDDENPEK